MAESTPTGDPNTIQSQPRLQPWRELTFFAVVAMELSWISLWFRLLIKPRQEIGYWQAFLVFGGILIAVYYADRGMSRQNFHIGARRGILAAIILVSMIVALSAFLNPREWLDLRGFISRSFQSFDDVAELLPAEFLVMGMVLLMGWRGLAMVGRQLEPSAIMGGFRTGIIMLFFYGMIVQFKEASPGWAFYLFLFWGLMGMSAARIAMQSRLRGGKSIPFDRRWLVGLTLVILSVVGLSYLVVSWLRARGLDLIFALYAWVMTVLIWLVSPFLYLVAELVKRLSEWMQFGTLIESLLELFKRVQSFFSELVATLQRWFSFLERLFRWDIQLPQFPKVVILWGTIIFFLVLILITLKRHVWKNESSEQENLSDLDQPDLITLLRAALRRTLDRLLEQINNTLGMRQARRMLAAARIRRIYARLLKLSARLDVPRPAARTPLEFLSNLVELFPGQSLELNTITQAYVRVRYGELPETVEAVDSVELAWKRIFTEGEGRLSAKRKRLRRE